MESKVTVLTPNGRRHNVKVSPNTTILQILEEVCRKYSFDSDSHCLKHHNREVSLTQPFRFSGLPNNCLLEMVETEKRRAAEKVDICIQLENGTRQLSKFESNESVWNVLQELCENVNTYENPVVLYMRQEICGKEDLTKATLKSLGIIEGRALLRLVDKKPEELKTQANVYKAPTQKDKRKEEEGGSSSTTMEDVSKKTGGGGGFSITKDLVKSLKANADITVANAMEQSSSNTKDKDGGNEDKDKDTRPKYDWGTGQGRSMQTSTNQMGNEREESKENEMETEPEMTIIGERYAILFSLENGQRGENDELPNSFYDLTVNDLKIVLRDLKRISTGNDDAPLMTQKQRELERQKMMLNKIAQYKNCIIRVQFPDSYVLQGVFKPSDTISNVVEFVRKFLKNQNAAFILFTIPPKTIMPLDKNLLELDLVPTAVLHFAWDTETTQSNDRTNIIKSEYMNQLTSIEGAIYAASKFRITNRSRVVSNNDDNDDGDDQMGPSTSAAASKRSRSNN